MLKLIYKLYTFPFKIIFGIIEYFIIIIALPFGVILSLLGVDIFSDK